MIPHHATDIEELQEAAHAEWTKTTKHTCRKLVRTMQERCRDVVAANGDHTDW